MRAERIATSVYQFVLFILIWAITFIVALIIVPGVWSGVGRPERDHEEVRASA
jgi:hypothetical protein